MRPYDWHAEAWQELWGKASRFPHAILLGGQDGLGKTKFGEALVARLLCENFTVAADVACGKCDSCVWLRSGNHPDYRLVQPEDTSATEAGEEGGDPILMDATIRKTAQGQLRIDQIRALEDFVFVGSHRHGNRVVLISQAETMNPAAANALLKILEEPPASVYFILISSHWRRLLPTLRSRCRKLILGYPTATVARSWLENRSVKNAAALLDLAGGVPLEAADWSDAGQFETYSNLIETLLGGTTDPVALAGKWANLLKAGSGLPLWRLVEAMQKWILDLGMLRIAGRCRYHRAWENKMTVLVGKASVQGISACYNDLLRIRAVAKHPLNPQLFLEDMAARYLRVLTPNKAQQV